MAIHPIVGIKRRRLQATQNASASIEAKSILTAKAEVGKVEIKTTDG